MNHCRCNPAFPAPSPLPSQSHSGTVMLAPTDRGTFMTHSSTVAGQLLSLAFAVIAFSMTGCVRSADAAPAPTAPEAQVSSPDVPPQGPKHSVSVEDMKRRGLTCTSTKKPDGRTVTDCTNAPPRPGPPTLAVWRHQHPDAGTEPSVFRQGGSGSTFTVKGSAKARTPLDPPVTKEIGPAGGEITSSDGLFTIRLPAGALKSTTAVSLQRFTNPLSPIPGSISYQSEPTNLQLAVPGQYIYHQPGLREGAPATSLGQDSPSDPDTVITVPGIVDRVAGTVTIPITHL